MNFHASRFQLTIIAAITLTLIIIFPTLFPAAVFSTNKAGAAETHRRNPALGLLVREAYGFPLSSADAQDMLAELSTIALPQPAVDPTAVPANYIAIGRQQEIFVYADKNFAPKSHKIDLGGDPFDVCSGSTYASDADYEDYLIYVFGTDVGTSTSMTVTDLWVKGLSFNDPTLFSPNGGTPSVSTSTCDTTKAYFVDWVKSTLPTGSSWLYDSKTGQFTITVSAMDASPLYYLLIAYFPKKTNVNLFTAKPKLLSSVTPTTNPPLIEDQQYLVKSGVSKFSIKPVKGSYNPDYVRVATRIPWWLAKDGTGVWFVNADPDWWDQSNLGSTSPPVGFTTAFPPNANAQSGQTRWRYSIPWDITSYPQAFSWDHVYEGQLTFSGDTFTDCSDFKTRGQVGADFPNTGLDFVVAGNWLVVKPAYPDNVRLSMDGSIDMGYIDSRVDSEVYNGMWSWVDYVARDAICP